MNQVFSALGLDDAVFDTGLAVVVIGLSILVYMFYRRLDLAAATLRVVCLWVLIIWPFALIATTLTSGPSYDPGMILIPLQDLTSMDGSILLTNVLGNLLLFAGPAAALVIYSHNRWAVVRVVLGALLVSTTIESLQYFTGRNVSIDDVLLNTIGALFGYGVGMAVLAAFTHRRLAIQA